MRFKKALMFMLVVFAFGLFAKNAPAADAEWKFVGKTKDKNFLVYYDAASVKFLKKGFAELRLKRERSAEGVEQFKKEFYASVKSAEKEAGSKVDGPQEPIIKALLEREQKEFDVTIDCAGNELRVLPSATDKNKINLVFDYDIEPGTAIENIKNAICPKN